jgi:hypothetical protein
LRLIGQFLEYCAPGRIGQGCKDSAAHPTLVSHHLPMSQVT